MERGPRLKVEVSREGDSKVLKVEKGKKEVLIPTPVKDGTMEVLWTLTPHPFDTGNPVQVG